MDSTNMQQLKPKSLQKTLEQVLEEKRAKDQANLDAEFRARAAQVQVLQGLTMKCGIIACPHCGKPIVDPRPTSPDDDYETRL